MGENFETTARDWFAEWFPKTNFARADIARLAALLSRVDAEAVERMAKMCDKEAAEYRRMEMPRPFDVTLTVGSSSLNGERALMYERAAHAIRSRLPTPAARAGEDGRSSRWGTNTGHGHVWERPDGVKMRCGGPALCRECAFDAATVKGKRQ